MNLLKGGTLGVEFEIPHVNRFGKSWKHLKDLMGDLDKKEIDKNNGEEKDEDEGEDDEEEKALEIENRKENDVDYGLINPRVKKDQP